MNSYKFDSIVNRQEADALKELIFKRARERAEALTNESQSSYTSSVRSEIMDLARDSFVANKNPFSAKVEAVSEPPMETPETESKAEIGFPERRIEEIKSQINYRNKVMDDEIIQGTISATMDEARGGFAKKSSFLGALDFLNSQASIALVNKRGKSFEALA